jgi:hypothetical protein
MGDGSSVGVRLSSPCPPQPADPVSSPVARGAAPGAASPSPEPSSRSATPRWSTRGEGRARPVRGGGDDGDRAAERSAAAPGVGGDAAPAAGMTWAGGRTTGSGSPADPPPPCDVEPCPCPTTTGSDAAEAAADIGGRAAGVLAAGGVEGEGEDASGRVGDPDVREPGAGMDGRRGGGRAGVRLLPPGRCMGGAGWSSMDGEAVWAHWALWGLHPGNAKRTTDGWRKGGVGPIRTGWPASPPLRAHALPSHAPQEGRGGGEASAGSPRQPRQDGHRGPAQRGQVLLLQPHVQDERPRGEPPLLHQYVFVPPTTPSTPSLRAPHPTPLSSRRPPPR